MSITNTRLAYLYRDADNYKVRHEVVFAGQMSEEEKMRIIASLDDGEYFIPGPLGLNDERFGSETEADHPFFEFCYFEETTDKPTSDISIAEIVKRFEDNAHLWKDYETSLEDVELNEVNDIKRKTSPFAPSPSCLRRWSCSGRKSAPSSPTGRMPTIGCSAA